MVLGYGENNEKRYYFWLMSRMFITQQSKLIIVISTTTSFWAEVTKNRNVIKAIAYTTDRGDEKQRQFQNILRAIGFEVKLKPYIQRSDGSAKGDWDVGITLDAMEYAKEADVVVLASGGWRFRFVSDENSNGL